MNSRNSYDIEDLASLLGLLAPPPEAWLVAASDLPTIRRAADQILALAEADAQFRDALLEDLEGALQRASFEPETRLVDEVHGRLIGRDEHPN